MLELICNNSKLTLEGEIIMAMNPSKAQDVWKDIGKSVQFTVLELKRENQAHEQEVIQEFADRYQAIIRSLRIRNGDGYLKASFGISNEAFAAIDKINFVNGNPDDILMEAKNGGKLVYDGQHGQKSTSENEESVGDTDNKTQSEDSNVALEKLNSLIGLDKVKKQVKEFINLNIINQKRKNKDFK